jgi:hypothetical protein
MGSANNAMASDNTNVPMMNAVLHPFRGKNAVQGSHESFHTGTAVQKGLGN